MGRKKVIEPEALRYIAQRIMDSGHVVNITAIAKVAGVNKSTVSRNLRQTGINPPPGKWFEGSRDAENRTHAEIARLIRAELDKENLSTRIGRPITGQELVERLGLRCSERMVRKIMRKYHIPNSWERARRK